MTPYDEQQVKDYSTDADGVFRSVGRRLGDDPEDFIWVGRMQFDAVTIGYAASRAKHMAELKLALKVPTNPSQPTAMTESLVVRGHFFGTESGQRFTAKIRTAFNLMNRWQHGEDVSPFMSQTSSASYNMLRVWTAYEQIDGIGHFTDIDYARIPEFTAYCAKWGFTVYFTGYTGWNDPHHWDRLCQAALLCSPRPILELVNELSANTNEPDSLGRVFDLSLYRQAPAPLLSSHGSNGAGPTPVRPTWSFEDVHSNDLGEWQRKAAHQAMECCEGADGAPGTGVPCIAGENTRYMDRCNSLAYAVAVGRSGALLCAGACFHDQAGKAALPSDPDAEVCLRAWASAADEVPIESQDGAYRHASELELLPDGTPDPSILRVYQRVLPDGRAFTAEIPT